MLSLGQFIQTINHATYKLDLIGTVGLFGGNNAIDALETIHLFPGRRWAGWYNYPGAVTVAKKFGQMAKGRLWDSLFPGPNESPEITFDLAGKSGPDYSAAFSGTKFQTKYPGYLVAGACADLPSKPLRLFNRDGTIGRETGNSTTVTVITLLPQSHEKVLPSVAKQNHNVIPINSRHDPPLALWAIVPSLVSLLAFVFCVIGRDWLCAFLILLGIVSSGFSSLVLGTATLSIRVPVCTQLPNPPLEGGLMMPADGSVIVLNGHGVDVDVITFGEFELDYSGGILPHEKHHTIGACSLLLAVQFLLQLLLIPLCTFFGQIMLLVSFIASGGYHLYVASQEKGKVHRELLLQNLSMRMNKQKIGTRTQAAVFTCLALGDNRCHLFKPGPGTILKKPDPGAILDCILPNDTPIWRYWKRKVVRERQRFWKWHSESSLPYTPGIQSAYEDQSEKDEYSKFEEREILTLNNIMDDAWCVFNGYGKWRDGESDETGPERERGNQELKNVA